MLMRPSRTEANLWLPDAVAEIARERGVTWLVGVDEAGRGPLAGPVVAAAVLITVETRIPGVNDSKKLSPERREALMMQIAFSSERLAVRAVHSEAIDRINILEASRQAMRDAVQGLFLKRRKGFNPQKDILVLVDGLPVPDFPIEALAVVGGDATCLPIAAASILAKVTRDRLMESYDQKYPQYGFAQHKGYPTPLHLERLREHGPCPIHRRSFAPVKRLLEANEG